MWVARNKDGSLELFEGRPYRMDKDSVVPEEYREGHWAYYSIHSVIGPHTIQHFSSKMLNSKLFPELTWEDEPVEVELIEKKHIEDTKEMQCNFCDKTFSYSPEDVISFNSLGNHHEMVICPHCKSKYFL